MPQGETITHDGIVLKATGDGTADVEIITSSACSGCHARSVCTPGSSETRTITVKSDAVLNPGDRVTVVMKKSQGFRALAIGYIIPFLVLIAALAITTIAGAGELISALSSFAAIGLYYLAVWILRDKIGEKFEFKIKV